MSSVADWLAWGALFVSVAWLAWSAHRYVSIQKREADYRRYQQFFTIMDMIGQQQGSIASKCAAVYELKKYKDYGEFLERFCRDAQGKVTGESADLLRGELRRTAEYFEGLRGTPR